LRVSFPAMAGKQSLATLATRLAQHSPDQVAFTFIDYSADLHGTADSLTWAELDARARALASELTERTGPGDRAAILAPQGLEYVVAMLAACYANVTAVPAFTPDLPGHRERLEAIVADADPACVLTTEPALPAVSGFLSKPRPVIPVSVSGPLPSPDFRPVPNAADDVAYLQYTSGSTRTPAGARITHGCLSANTTQIATALDLTPGSVRTVGWLPLFHDMGLVMTVAMSFAMGMPAMFMDPAAFLMRPVRWLQLMADTPDSVTAAPNFAYDYCATRIATDDIASLDLSRVRGFLNGAEPVRASTLRRFAGTFARCGLSPAALIPAYGLAEATVYVASAAGRTPARVIGLDRTDLAHGTATMVAEDTGNSITGVSCGRPTGQHVVIVDPKTATECPPGQVGEIWVNGPNVAAGYFGQATAFDAELTDPPTGTPARGWLRTGDLGVLLDEELFVTGRLKDVIIIDGRNHYPQDIEATAQDAHPAIRRDRVAAFAVSDTAGDRVVIVAERSRGEQSDADQASVARVVRGAVAVRHDIRLHDFVLVRPGMVPRTSSGKISRSASRNRYLEGAFT
jgi:acyl-CoA synthetase (AMP-forming)/AMP-acid ligase II